LLPNDGDAYLFQTGETVRQIQTNGDTVTGRILSRFNDTLVLTDAPGIFNTSNTVVGLTSGGSSEVLAVDSTVGAQASGIISSTSIVGANGSIALTEQKGIFMLSDSLTNTINTFRGQTTQAVASITGLDTTKTKLKSGTGNFLYVEQFVPIERDQEQTERFKFIITF
jgi:hypothetical protein